jgi:5,10-methylenetetrahydrofolate reductase
MSLCDKIYKGKFLVTSEVAPPKGIDVKEVLEEADVLKGRVDAINVTDLQSSIMRLGSLTMCYLLKQRGHEVVYQLTCRDRNRLALQSDLLSAAALGIENVLALTGDHPSMGDHPQAKAVFDLDSVQLLETIKTLQSGKDLAQKELQGIPKFCAGAVVNPGADPLEPEIIKMEKKVRAGAEFFQTQAVYTIDKFARFMDKVKYLNVPVLAGIVLLKSAGMAKFMNENVAGVFVPQNLIDEMKSVSKEDRPKKSIEIAVRLIKELKPLCSGIHIMPLGWDKYVPAVLDAAGL